MVVRGFHLLVPVMIQMGVRGFGFDEPVQVGLEFGEVGEHIGHVVVGERGGGPQGLRTLYATALTHDDLRG